MNPIPVNVPVLNGNEAKYVQQAVETGGFHLKALSLRNLRQNLLRGITENMELLSVMELPHFNVRLMP